MSMTFFKLLAQHRIEIPMIQRDYAQGRKTEKAKSIRENFVRELLRAFEVPKKQLRLAVVYGRMSDNGVFVPIDGQQRLTTLFLLHVYLVRRSQGAEALYWLLSNFSYATRQAARDFCSRLADPDVKILPDEDSEKKDETVSSVARKQTWYQADWNDDPTIAGMLVMLDEIQKQVEDRLKSGEDGMAKSWVSRLLCGANEVSALSRESQCPIVFDFLDMDAKKLSDDLYLKMNARGLPLTALENVKCEIERFCEKNGNLFATAGGKELHLPSSFSASEEERFAKLSFGKRFTYLFDRHWLDAFWSVKAEMSECNSSMTVVLARLFAFSEIEKIDDCGDEYKKHKKQVQGLVEIWGSEEFLPFEKFEWVLSPATLCRVGKWLNLFFAHQGKKVLIDKLAATWAGAGAMSWSSFFAKFKNGVAWKDLAAFYAELAFFDYEDCLDEREFADWMRVQWNIIENGNIDSLEALWRFIKFCHGLAKMVKNGYAVGEGGCSKILRCLGREGDLPGGLVKAQVAEESKKARMILRSREIKGNVEKRITAAENLPWFKGRIAAILQEECDEFDADLEKGYGKDGVLGTARSEQRKQFVKYAVGVLEDEYEYWRQHDRGIWVDMPLKSIILYDRDLKNQIYYARGGDKKNGECMEKAARGMIGEKKIVERDNNWLTRMGVNWFDFNKLSSYFDAQYVYAYVGTYITGAYRVDAGVNWWHELDEVLSKHEFETNWGTRDYGSVVMSKSKDGHQKFFLADYGQGRCYVQFGYGEKCYPDKEEDAIALFKECGCSNANDTNTEGYENLIKKLCSQAQVPSLV